MSPLSLFVACLPGLEDLLFAEVSAVCSRAGGRALKKARGGVALEGDFALAQRLNLRLGIATQVLVRIARFPARHLSELDKKARRVEWSRWVPEGAEFSVRATCRKSRLYHSGAVSQRVERAIADATRGVAKPSGKEDEEQDDISDRLLLQVRVDSDECRISLNTSGAPLHRRGYRLATGKAPLREDLAHALVRASGWDRASPVIDPFCGSGTILIEAAALARQLPPGRQRAFAFRHIAGFDADAFAQMRTEEIAAARPKTGAPLFGSDRDAGVIDACQSNAERAGVESDLELTCASVSDAPILCGRPEPGETGALLSNPPFGRRIGKGQAPLEPLYQRLGHLVAGLPGGFRIALLAADPRLARRVGRPLRTAFSTQHGGIPVSALVDADPSEPDAIRKRKTAASRAASPPEDG